MSLIFQILQETSFFRGQHVRFQSPLSQLSALLDRLLPPLQFLHNQVQDLSNNQVELSPALS